MNCNPREELRFQLLLLSREARRPVHTVHSAQPGVRAEYNSVRLIFSVLIALFFGTAFWQMGMRRYECRDHWKPESTFSHQ